MSYSVNIILHVPTYYLLRLHSNIDSFHYRSASSIPYFNLNQSGIWSFLITFYSSNEFSVISRKSLNGTLNDIIFSFFFFFREEIEFPIFQYSTRAWCAQQRSINGMRASMTSKSPQHEKGNSLSIGCLVTRIFLNYLLMP